MENVGTSLADWTNVPSDNILNPGQQCYENYSYGPGEVKVGLTITVRIMHDPSGTLLFDGAVTVKK
jgi:hypothetical protein